MALKGKIVTPRVLQSPIGLIAGNGNFPLEFITSAKARSLEVVVVAHRGECDPSIENIASKCLWIRVGELGKLIKFFRSCGVKQAAFVGGISKPKLFKNLKPDLKGILTMMKLRTFNDDVILRGTAKEIERSGIEIFGPYEILEKCIVKKGVLTNRALSSIELENARIGWETAEGLGRFDVGQTVVVNRKTVVAVEAVEGTDSCIERAGAISGEGCSIIKISKPGQDLRFDMPAIGEKTIETMIKVSAKSLILQAESCLMYDPAAVVSKANAADISIVAVKNINELQ